MSLTSIIKLIRRRQLLPALKAKALYRPFYTLTWLAAAKQGGLLDLLGDGASSLDDLARVYGDNDKAREGLEAWLQMGVHLGLLGAKDGCYRLRGLLHDLSLARNDAALALVQEAATLHHKLILDTPTRLHERRLWQLDDQDGELTARSSLALEAFQQAAIDAYFPDSGAISLLEVGCGAAGYIRYAAARNPALRATGLELQPRVAGIAHANIRRWGLTERVTIEPGDIRDRAAAPEFDIVTLYNNIYYFPVAGRVALLEHLGRFIKPDGFLLLTTCCRGGSLGMDALNLWGAATATGGRLPDVTEMRDQLAEAGYTHVDCRKLVPGDSYYAFRASRPAV